MERKTRYKTVIRRHNVTTNFGLSLLVGISVMAACSASSGPSTFESTGQSSSSTTGNGGSANSSSSGEGGIDIGFGAQGPAGGSGGGPINCIPKGPDDDVDGDGYTPNEGDCNDCDKFRNPWKSLMSRANPRSMKTAMAWSMKRQLLHATMHSRSIHKILSMGHAQSNCAK